MIVPFDPKIPSKTYYTEIIQIDKMFSIQGMLCHSIIYSMLK